MERARNANIGAADATWFVYTGWDAWATNVSGSAALIDALIADDELKAVEIPPR